MLPAAKGEVVPAGPVLFCWVSKVPPLSANWRLAGELLFF